MSVRFPSCLPVRPSVRPLARTGRLGYHRNDFHEVWYLSIFRKSVDEVQVSMKSEKNNGYLLLLLLLRVRRTKLRKHLSLEGYCAYGYLT